MTTVSGDRQRAVPTTHLTPKPVDTRLIERLPSGYRAMFVLHDVQGYQHNEITEILGRSVGVSKSQLYKARMRLRELLHEVQREKARDERLAGCKLVPGPTRPCSL